MFIVGSPFTKAQSGANVVRLSSFDIDHSADTPPQVLVLVSAVSLLAVLGLLAAIFTSAFNTRTSKDQHLFVHTYVAVYFTS